MLSLDSFQSGQDEILIEGDEQYILKDSLEKELKVSPGLIIESITW